MKFKLKHSYYKSATPEKMRKIGDAILIAGPILEGAVMQLPISDTTKQWVNFAITIITVGGKILTNFFAEDTHKEQENCDIPPVEEQN